MGVPTFSVKMTYWNVEKVNDCHQWEGGGGGEMVKECEYGTNTVYTCMQNGKMISFETIPPPSTTIKIK
jgi:hypothetical protein